jgi:hypothetical protein
MVWHILMAVLALAGLRAKVGGLKVPRAGSTTGSGGGQALLPGAPKGQPLAGNAPKQLGPGPVRESVGDIVQTPSGPQRIKAIAPNGDAVLEPLKPGKPAAPTKSPKPDRPKTEPSQTKTEPRRSAAEVQKHLEQEGLTQSEILGFSGGPHAQKLSRASAARVERLLKYFSCKRISKSWAGTFFNKDIILNDAAVDALISGCGVAKWALRLGMDGSLKCMVRRHDRPEEGQPGVA